MRKRLIVALVGLVGLVVVALGVASATLWRADDVLVAELRADEPLVVTDPGVLELAADEVTVRVTADGPVVLAVGRDTDVTGWVGEDPHQRVTGLAEWHRLAAEGVTAAATPTASASAGTPAPAPTDQPAADAAAPADPAAQAAAPADPAATPAASAPAAGDGAPAEAVTVPDPTGSDMWVLEEAGDGEAELTWTAQPGRWSLLVASTDGSAPRLTLSWPQVVTTPWLWPCVGLGSLLVLGAGGLLLRDVLRGRRGPDTGWTPVGTGELPVVGGEGSPVQLTRRQLRELAAHGAVLDAGRTPRDATVSGTAPQHPTADQPGLRPGDAPSERGAAALAAIAPATRRALRAVTSRGSSGRDEGGEPAAAPEATPAAAQASPPTGRPDAGASRPSWGPRGAGPAPGASVPGPAVHQGTPTWSATGSPTWTPAPPPGAAPAAPAARAAGPVAPQGEVARGPVAPQGAPGPGPALPPSHPSGRPAWLRGGPQGTQGPVLPVPGAPGSPDSGRVAPSGPARPPAAAPATAALPPGASSGWSPVPPRPGAVAGRATGPDAAPPRTDAAPPGAHREAPRPAWLRDTPVPEGPRPGTAAPDAAGSRADAWRRAWGLPPTDDDASAQEEGR